MRRRGWRGRRGGVMWRREGERERIILSSARLGASEPTSVLGIPHGGELDDDECRWRDRSHRYTIQIALDRSASRKKELSKVPFHSRLLSGCLFLLLSLLLLLSSSFEIILDEITV